MDIIHIQYLAGSISSLMFAAGTLPMVFKAIRTRDLRSYSLGNIALSNLGNLVYWIYLAGLPFGPVWFLHIFNTVTTLVMLLLYLHHETACRLSNISQCLRSAPTCFASKAGIFY